MCIFLGLCNLTYRSNFKNFIYKANCVYGIYRHVYTYIQVQIRIRAYTGLQQLEYTLKSKIKKKRDPLVSVGITNRD
jgi:hypothetical protein